MILAAVEKRVADLLALEEDWDSYGADPPSPATAARALAWLGTLPPETAAPWLVPTVNGGVAVEWHEGGWDVELEFESTGAVAAWAEERATRAGWEHHGDLAGAVDRLAESLRAAGVIP